MTNVSLPSNEISYDRVNITHIQLIAFTILAGASWPAGRVVALNVDPITASYYRYLIAFPFFLVFLRKQPKTDVRDWKLHIHLFILSLLNITLYNILFLEGIAKTTASEATLVFASAPTITLIIAHFAFSDERISFRKIIGIVSAFFGVMILFITHPIGSSDTHLLGNSLILMSAGVMASYTVFSRPLFKNYNLVQISTWMVFYGLLTLACIVPLENSSNLNPFAFFSLPLKVILSIGYLGLYIVFAIYSYNQGIQQIGPSRTAVYMNLIPIFGIISSILLISEKFSVWYAFSFIFIIFGVYVVNKKPI